VKTGSGRRAIGLDPGTVDVLKAWHIERAEERGGVEPRADDLVFTKPDGRDPLNSVYVAHKPA